MRLALISAASELFARRGPAAVSVREIALYARVNHALVHRHFGSKQELLRAVLEHLGSEIAGSVDPDGRRDDVFAFFEAAAASPYWRVLARAVLDDQLPDGLQGDFPTVRRLVDLFRSGREQGWLDSTFEPRLAAAVAVAMGLGWLAFEPFVVRATGLAGDDQADVRRRFRRATADLIGRLGPREADPDRRRTR